MGEMGTPDFIGEKLIQKAIISDRQDAALKKIGQHEVIKRHDDGDLTIQDANGCLHVITTEGETFTEQSCACKGIPQSKARRLLDAHQVSDFDLRTDRVVRRGDRTYIVDTSGLKADMEVSSDVITPEIKANLLKLTPEQKIKMKIAVQNTPFLSPDGMTERLAVLRAVTPEGIEPKAAVKRDVAGFNKAFDDLAKREGYEPNLAETTQQLHLFHGREVAELKQKFGIG